jgi:hypothetical protein
MVVMLPGGDDAGAVGEARQREWIEGIERWRREYPTTKAGLQAALAPHDAFDLLAALQIASAIEFPRGHTPSLQHAEGAREILALVLVERGARPPVNSNLDHASLVTALELFGRFAESVIIATPECLTPLPVPMDDGPETALAEIRSRMVTMSLLSPVSENDDQVDRTTAELFDHPLVRAHLLKELGIDVTTVLQLTDAVADLTARGYRAAIEDSRTSRSWSGHGRAMSFTIADLAKASRLELEQADTFADRFALDLDGEPFRQGELTTRARHRPFLRDGDRLMAIAVPTLRRSLRRSLAALLNPQLPAAGQGSKSAFSVFTAERGRWLERGAMATLERALRPNWSQLNVNFELPDGRRGEIDGLSRIGDTLLVVQAKSGVTRLDTEVSDPDRFRETLVALLGGDGFRQHRDALAALSPPGGNLTRDVAGTEPLRRNLDGVARIIPLLVTLEDLSVVGAQPWLLVDAGLAQETDLPWIVGIDSLELLLEFFELPAIFIHFLRRRLRANRTRQLIASDEIDWAVRYGEDELLWAELPPDHTGADRQFMFPDEHHDFDRWQVARQGGERAKRPRPSLSAAMRKLLTRIDRSRPDGWLEFSLALLELRREHRPSVLRLWQQQMDSDRRRQAIPLSKGFGRDGQPEIGFSVLREERNPHPHGDTVLRQFCEDQLIRYGAHGWRAIVVPFRPRDPIRWCCCVEAS